MLSWSVFFMNSDKTIYGRFGRAHPQTKRAKKDSNPNHTVAGLRAALEKALEVHATYQKNPEILGPALAGKTGPKPRWRFADKTPAARKYGRLERITQNRHGCVHCHEVIRTAIDSHFMTKTPIPDRMLWMYPRPHVLGLTMDSRKRAIVRAVEAGFAGRHGRSADRRRADHDEWPAAAVDRRHPVDPAHHARRGWRAAGHGQQGKRDDREDDALGPGLAPGRRLRLAIPHGGVCRLAVGRREPPGPSARRAGQPPLPALVQEDQSGRPQDTGTRRRHHGSGRKDGNGSQRAARLPDAGQATGLDRQADRAPQQRAREPLLPDSQEAAGSPRGIRGCASGSWAPDTWGGST